MSRAPASRPAGRNLNIYVSDQHYAGFHGDDEGQRILACGRIEMRCAFASMSMKKMIASAGDNDERAAKRACMPAKAFRVVSLPFSI